MTAAGESLPGFAEALSGQFLLERELGRGGMGVVYLARDVALDRAVAIKVLPPDLARLPGLRERFLREARTAAQLSHPNIVPVHRADEAGGHAYFVMTFVEGETLGARLQAMGRLAPGEVARILREAAWALAYAHGRGIVHRDVKPENVLLERGSGRVLLTDFGIARDQNASALTQEGLVMGTAHFMSPEQVQGEPLDGRSDLYALGVVGYYALSGRLPFAQASQAAVLVAHVTAAPESLARVAPDVPPELAAVVERCLAKDPAARWPDGEALAAALDRAMGAVQHASPAHGLAADAVLSEAQARAVWARAAQLQVEAAARIEARSRTGALERPPTAPEGYRLRDVEAAAVEAGISAPFVQLALSELPADAGVATDDPNALTPPQDRAITRLLGTDRRSVSVSRLIRASPARVLEALGRVATAPPYGMTLFDIQGGHPLEGGILLFDIPDMGKVITASGGYSPFIYHMEQLELRRVRLTLRPAEGGRACEVVLYGDLRPGMRANLVACHWLSWLGGAGLGVIGFAVGVAPKALALGATLALAPGAVGLGLGLAASYAGYRLLYRGALRGGVEELEGMLAAVERALRSLDVFGAGPSALAPGPAKP